MEDPVVPKKTKSQRHRENRKRKKAQLAVVEAWRTHSHGHLARLVQDPQFLGLPFAPFKLIRVHADHEGKPLYDHWIIPNRMQTKDLIPSDRFLDTVHEGRPLNLPLPPKSKLHWTNPCILSPDQSEAYMMFSGCVTEKDMLPSDDWIKIQVKRMLPPGWNEEQHRQFTHIPLHLQVHKDTGEWARPEDYAADKVTVKQLTVPISLDAIVVDQGTLRLINGCAYSYRAPATHFHPLSISTIAVDDSKRTKPAYESVRRMVIDTTKRIQIRCRQIMEAAQKEPSGTVEPIPSSTQEEEEEKE